MELGHKKAVTLGLAALFWLVPAQALDFEVRHDHWRKGCEGTLHVDADGVSFQGKQHSWDWTWQDVQWFVVSPRRIEVVTYKDNRWRLGADRSYEFQALSGEPFGEVYALLKDRLDRRLVAELVDDAVRPLWEIPVKRLGRIQGSEGMLLVGQDRIVYRSLKPEGSYTWRYKDIENISTSDVFHLTLSTLKENFNFQLKQELSEDRYDDLWRRINRGRGLKSLAETAAMH